MALIDNPAVLIGEFMPRDSDIPNIPLPSMPWSSESRYPAMLFTTFLYGLYVVLLFSCVYYLAKRKATQRVLLGAILAMFVVASADLCLTLFFFFRFVLQGEWAAQIRSKSLDYKFILYLTANAITTGLFIDRCYVVWMKKWVIVPPILLLISGTIPGYMSVTGPSIKDNLKAASFISIVAGNIIVTALIAVRMSWISRKASFLLAMKGRILRFSVSVAIESGAIYTLFVLLYLMVHPLVIDVALTQIAGLTATLMVVEVAARNREARGGISTFAVSMMPSEAHGHSVVGTPSRSRSQIPVAQHAMTILRRTETMSTVFEDPDKVY